MDHSSEINALAKALSVAQSQIEPPKKTLKGKIKGVNRQGKPYEYEYDYSDLAGIWEAARKPLGENGLAVLQWVKTQGASVTVETMLLHESGQWFQADPLTIEAARPEAQPIGSAATYARRYAIMPLLGIAPEDDDGQGAMPQNDQEASRLASRVKIASEMAGPVDAGAVATVDDYAPTITNVADLDGYGKSIQEQYKDGQMNEATYQACRKTLVKCRKRLQSQEMLDDDAVATAAAASEGELPEKPF